MTHYDLCFAWNWQHDADLAVLLESACRGRGLSLLQVTGENLDRALKSLKGGELTFWAFLDRASDADAQFVPLAAWAHSHAAYRINPCERASRASDKAAMHLALIDAGLHTPYTIVLPPYVDRPTLPPLDLTPLGGRFAIKPAHGGGGEGVVVEATTIDQVLACRQEYPADTYLLQAHVVPRSLGTRPAWFRVIYCTGRVYPCWWDTHTHVYALLAAEDEAAFSLGPLRQATNSIARICGLDLFSTEVSFTADGRFVIVDYVNDQIDLRLQSRVADGVPDDIVCDIADRLASVVQAHRPDGSTGRQGP